MPVDDQDINAQIKKIDINLYYICKIVKSEIVILNWTLNFIQVGDKVKLLIK